MTLVVHASSFPDAGITVLKFCLEVVLEAVLASGLRAKKRKGPPRIAGRTVLTHLWYRPLISFSKFLKTTFRLIFSVGVISP